MKPSSDTRSLALRQPGRMLALLVVALAALAATAQNARADITTIRINNSALAPGYEEGVSGMWLRLDSTGGALSDFHADGEPTDDFWLPEFVHHVSGGLGGLLFPNSEIHMTLDDVLASDFRARVVGRYLELTAEFETEGNEIRLECLTSSGNPCTTAFLAPSFESAVQLEDATVKVRLTLERGTWIRPVFGHDNEIPDVSFHAEVDDVAGLCTFFYGLCADLSDYFSSSAFEEAIQTTIERTLIRSKDAGEAIGAAAHDDLVERGLIGADWRVVSWATSRGFWTLKMEKPPFIDADTVKIVAFKPLVASVTHTCPVDIAFTATISVKTPVSGHVWLRHENGGVSPKLNWSSGKGTATSRITRTIRRLDAPRRNRWSKLVLEWRGFYGGALTTSSARVHYTVNCLKSTGSKKAG